MRKRDSGNEAVSLLASSVVILLGGVGCLVVVLASAPEPGKLIVYLAAGMVVLFAGTWWANRPADRERPFVDWLHWNLYGPKGKEKPEFKVKLLKPPPQVLTPRRPPTVEELREMKGGMNNWVPPSSRDGRKQNQDKPQS